MNKKQNNIIKELDIYHHYFPNIYLLTCFVCSVSVSH